MMVFLQVLGIIFLVLLALLLVGLFFVRRFIRRILDQAALDSPIPEPLIIHLNEELAPDWLAHDDVKRNCAILEEMGFARGACYAIYEMDAFRLVSFYRDPITAVVYWHESLGSWCDVVIVQRDGHEFTFSNAAMGSGLDSRPESVKDYSPDDAVADLVRKAERIIDAGRGPFVTVHNADFREFFEQAYKKDMAWKSRKGGISYEEFLSVAQESGEACDEEALREAYVRTKEEELYRWEQAALENYQSENGLSDEDLEALEDKLVVVPFTTDAEAFVNYLEFKGFVSESQADKVIRAYRRENDIIQLFDRLNGFLSPEIRARHLTSAEFPLPIKIYRLHESMVA